MSWNGPFGNFSAPGTRTSTPCARRQAGGAGRQERHVRGSQIGLRPFRDAEKGRLLGARLIRGAVKLGRGQDIIGRFALGGDEIGRPGGRSILPGQPELRAGLAVLRHNALGQEIGDSLARTGLIDAEDMVEGAVFANDDNEMLDRACRCRFLLPRSLFLTVGGYSHG